MIDILYDVEVLPVVWPGKKTRSQRRSPFRSTFTRATAMLSREIRALRAKNVRIALDINPSSVRQDGRLRADAKVLGSAVVVSFDVEAGRLAFPCDSYTDWHDNIYAIAQAMEKLRAIDRYGVQTGRQYTGFRAIPASTDNGMTVEVAADVVRRSSGHMQNEVIRNAETAKYAIRLAAMEAHPDKGGNSAAFDRVQKAKAVLEQHHGRKF